MVALDEEAADNVGSVVGDGLEMPVGGLPGDECNAALVLSSWFVDVDVVAEGEVWVDIVCDFGFGIEGNIDVGQLECSAGNG